MKRIKWETLEKYGTTTHFAKCGDLYAEVAEPLPDSEREVTFAAKRGPLVVVEGRVAFVDTAKTICEKVIRDWEAKGFW